MKNVDLQECAERAHGTCANCAGSGTLSTPRGVLPCDCIGIEVDE